MMDCKIKKYFGIPPRGKAACCCCCCYYLFVSACSQSFSESDSIHAVVLKSTKQYPKYYTVLSSVSRCPCIVCDEMQGHPLVKITQTSVEFISFSGHDGLSAA